LAAGTNPTSRVGPATSAYWGEPEDQSVKSALLTRMYGPAINGQQIDQIDAPHMPSDDSLTLTVVGIPDSLCITNASAKRSSGGRVLVCGRFTCDIQQSLSASLCFLFAINRSHSLAAIRLAAMIPGIRSGSNACRQRFGMRSSACVEIIHRAPVTTLRPSSTIRA
jgi:hypothetical protein